MCSVFLTLSYQFRDGIKTLNGAREGVHERFLGRRAKRSAHLAGEQCQMEVAASRQTSLTPTASCRRGKFLA